MQTITHRSWHHTVTQSPISHIHCLASTNSGTSILPLSYWDKIYIGMPMAPCANHTGKTVFLQLGGNNSTLSILCSYVLFLLISNLFMIFAQVDTLQNNKKPFPFIGDYNVVFTICSKQLRLSNFIVLTKTTGWLTVMFLY